MKQLWDSEKLIRALVLLSFSTFAEVAGAVDAPAAARSDLQNAPGSQQILAEVLDADSGKPLPARIYIQGTDGVWHFATSTSSSGSAVEYRNQKTWNPGSVEMHTTVSAHPFIAKVPRGKYTLLVERGKEYIPETRQLDIDKGEARVTIPLRRWINMEESGWYSGDTHVHRTLTELPNLMLAEDLNVAFPLTSWVRDAFVAPAASSSKTQQSAPGELIEIDRTHVFHPRNTEYEIFQVGKKSHTLGAFFVLGHKTLFEESVPPVAPVLRRARNEGALIELDKHNWPWSMMLIPILNVDLYELANNHLWRTDFGYRDYGVAAADYMRVERNEKGWAERGWIDYGFQNYYALLNCGFRLRPTAGTASGVHPVPLGFGRVYVHLDQQFSYEAWLRGLNAGRSFVTTGPMLFVQVNGKQPGHVFKTAARSPYSVRIVGTARYFEPLQRVEIVVNGELARTVALRSQEMSGRGYALAIDEELIVDQSSWIAVRCFVDEPRLRFAHSAPFFVEIDDKPLRPRKAEIEFLIKRVKDELVRNTDVLPAAALEEYREALRVYEGIAERAR